MEREDSGFHDELRGDLRASARWSSHGDLRRHLPAAECDRAGRFYGAQAIIEALENIEYTGVLGDVSFEYTSKNPVPDGQPAWMWHQFMTPAVFQLQYTEVNQTSGEAVVVYPRERATGPLYTSP